MYHKERSDNFTDKLATIAKFAGITAIALGSAPHIGQSLGRLGTSVAKEFADSPGLIRKIVGKSIGTEDARSMFSSAFNFLADEVPRLDNVIFTGEAHTARNRAIMDSLSEQVHSSTKNAFENQKGALSEAMSSLLRGVEKENVDVLMSDTLWDRFLESSKGVQWKFMDKKAVQGIDANIEHRKKLSQILSHSLEKAEKNRQSTKQILNTGSNLKEVMDVLSRQTAKLKKIDERNTKLFGHANLQKITIGDLDKNTGKPDVIKAVKSYLDKVGTDTNYHTKAGKSLHEFIHGLDFSQTGLGVRDDFINQVNSLHTGLVLDENGQVFSLAHPANTAKNLLSKAAQNFQIPMVPGAFNIPGTIGRFLLPDSESIKFLGKMSYQGELKRAGRLAGLSEDAFGISIGDSILSFDKGIASKIEGLSNFINTSGSEHAKHFARSRNLPVEPLLDKFTKDVSDKGFGSALWDYVRSNDEHSPSHLKKLLYGRQDELFDLTYTDKNGFTLLPKENYGDVSVGAAMASIGKMSGLNSSEINPTLLMRFINENVHELPTEAAQDAYRQIFKHADSAKVDSSMFLGQVANIPGMFDHYNLGGPLDLSSKIREMMLNSGNPEALLKTIVQDTGGGSLIDNYSLLSKTLSPELSRAIAAVGENRERLLEIGTTNLGFSKKTLDGVMGSDTLSSLHLQVQRGLISEAVRSSGVKTLTSHTGLGIAQSIEELSKGNLPDTAAFMAAKMGFTSTSDIGKLVDTIRSNNGIDFGDLGSIVSPLADFDHLFALTGDPLVKAKVAESARADSLLGAFYVGKTEANVRVLKQLAEGADMVSAIQKRYGLGGTLFTPLDEDYVTPRFYATIKGGDVDPIEPGFGVIHQLEAQIKRGFGAVDFFRQTVDPNAPASHAGYVANVLMHMPQSVGNPLGLGLNSEEGVTVGRSIAGFALKRVLPAYIALEMYKNFNADMHNVGLNGLDDMGANIYANIGLAKSKFTDSFGLTDPMKSIVSAIPGLDQYSDPKSEDEFREDLFYGEELVRKGRFFVIGSRTPFTGGSVEYSRPNAYRRLKGHWTEADNVQLSNPSFSFLPTLTNPLAPLNRLLNPHWAERLTAKDRPYMSSSELHHFINNQDAGIYFDNAPSGEEGPIGYGSFGGDLPTVLRSFSGYSGYAAWGGVSNEGSGGEGGAMGPTGAGTGHSGGANQLGEAFYSPGTSKIRIGNRKDIPVDELQHHGLFNHSAKMMKEVTRHMGLYGGVIRNSPFLLEESGAIEVQDPSKAFSNNRLFFSGEFGELTGPLGEFYRRFISEDNQSYDAFNPMPNSMPSWLPSKFSTGDPYMRIPMGELNLPGDAYERTHPQTRPMKARGSMIGLSVEEMVGKMLDPVGAYESDEAEDIMGYGCVDASTEILTLNGWTTQENVKEGDIVLTLNHETGFSEWQPVLFMNRYQVEEEDMLLLETKGHSSLTTFNHKWPVIFTSSLSYKEDERKWITSEKIGQRNYGLIVGAENENIPTKKKYSDAFVQLVAWFYTEGSIESKLIEINQCEKANPEYVKEIIDILTSLYGPPSECIGGPGKKTSPKWRISKRGTKTSLIRFRLNTAASQKILEIVPDKIVPRTFIFDLTKEQLQLFLDTTVKADGHRPGLVGQKVKDRTDAIELASILLGYKTSYFHRNMHNKAYPKATEHQISFSKNKLIKFNHNTNSRKIVKYSGIVWCPTTPNSTWCARREGKVFYTGNSEAHKLIMRQMRDSGILVGAEVAGYDREHNISATIESVVRGKTGLEVVEIKTRGNETFNTDPEKYIDQLMFYMYLTGTKQGHIAHVNRDNPNQVRFATYQYDPQRMEAIFGRVEEARDIIRGMVSDGKVSPYETYDLLSRIEILSRVAPDSAEFREYVEHAETKGGFGGMEQVRFERSLEVAKKLREDFNLYPYKNTPTETRSLLVESITDNGEIVTEMGVVKLAGVKFDKQTFILEDPETVLGRYGIHVGGRVPITLVRGQFDPNVMKDTTTSALIGNVNRSLIKSEYADPDYEDRTAMGARARGNKIASSIEKTLHSENILSNKFLRVRSGLEQFERGEVFGTENQSYSDLYGNYIEPTFNMVVSKNPIIAALQGGLVTSFFVRGKEAKGRAAIVGGAVAGAVSLLTHGEEFFTGRPHVPKRYKKQTEFDEYYDLISFIKDSSFAESARQEAYIKEGVDIRTLNSNEKRTRVQIGSYSALAVDAERKAKRTMFGFDVASGTLQEALSAIPKRHRQVAESVITQGTEKEKERFYSLLPNSEKRVLGKFLGVDEDDLPEALNLDKYFSKHNLPDTSWLGWKRDVDLEDIRIRALDLEGMKVERPSRMRASKARAYTKDVPVPKMHSSSHARIRNVLDKLASTGQLGKIKYAHSYLPSNDHSVNVNVKFVDTNHQKTQREFDSQF